MMDFDRFFKGFLRSAPYGHNLALVAIRLVFIELQDPQNDLKFENDSIFGLSPGSYKLHF